MMKKKNKSTYRDNLTARGNEAKTVRKIVSIILVMITLILFIGGISGYIYIKSALQPVDPDNKKRHTCGDTNGCIIINDWKNIRGK